MATAAGAALPPIPKELIDQFVTGPMSAEAVNAVSTAFKRALIERVLGAELSGYLGYLPGARKRSTTFLVGSSLEHKPMTFLSVGT